MAEITTLPITGFNQEPVPNQFRRQHGDTDHLAILLPGVGYTCDMPLLYYAEFLLLSRDADVLRVDYSYNRRPDLREASQEELSRRLFADTSAALRAGLAQRTYREVTFVGKSLGTLAMGHLLAPEHRPTQTIRAVWLTPILSDTRVREHLMRDHRSSFLAIGTADPRYDVRFVGHIRAETEIETVVVEDANHSLDVSGDVVASVQSVEWVIGALGRWLTRSYTESG